MGTIDWASTGRVLAVRLDNLGDVVLITPALRALRAALPAGAQLDLLASLDRTTLDVAESWF